MSESITLTQLLEGLAQPDSDYDYLTLTGLASNTAYLQPGDWFVALTGSNGHGANHWAKAQAAGAIGMLVETPWPAELPAMDWPMVAVPQLKDHLLTLAQRCYGQPQQQLNLIGITGTDGKSSCSHFLAQALNHGGALGTLGYGRCDQLTPLHHTTPDLLTIMRALAQMRDQKIHHVAMELSSHALDQKRCQGLTLSTAVLTNLARDHLDYHGTVEHYQQAKAKLFTDYQAHHWVVNTDDAFGRALAQQCPERCIGYGFQSAHEQRLKLQLQGIHCQFTPMGSRFTLQTNHGQQAQVELALLGQHNIANSLAVAAVLLAHQVPFEQLANRLAKLQGVPGRMELFAYQQRAAVVDYAHTPRALQHALRAMRQHVRGKIGCVFGCGGNRDRGKRSLMAQAAEQGADWIIITDDNPRFEPGDDIVADICQGFDHPERVDIMRDRPQAIAQALERLGPNDGVLIAGKGHETLQLIGDQALTMSDRALVCDFWENKACSDKA